jgi:hypothetical protein
VKNNLEVPVGNGDLPHSTIYRLDADGRWEVDVARGGLLVYKFRSPISPATTPPTVIIGMRYGQRTAIASIRDLMDRIEFGDLNGPGDWLAFNEPDPQDSAA